MTAALELRPTYNFPGGVNRAPLETRPLWTALRVLNYGSAVERADAYIEMKLEVPAAIELTDFVSAFTALGTEYDRFVRERQPDSEASAKLFVQEVRKGSIIATLVPLVIASWPVMVHGMDSILVLEDFVTRYGRRLSNYLNPRTQAPDVSRQELRDFYDQVSAVAAQPDSNLQVAAFRVRQGRAEATAAFQFDTQAARRIQDNVQSHRRSLDQADQRIFERQLMLFTRSDVGSRPLGASTGERVLIESLHDRSLPLIYASDLAESAIKHEIREANENIYKKGFIVDCYYETRSGRPIAYRVTHLHQVIDLDD